MGVLATSLNLQGALVRQSIRGASCVVVGTLVVGVVASVILDGVFPSVSLSPSLSTYIIGSHCLQARIVIAHPFSYHSYPGCYISVCLAVRLFTFGGTYLYHIIGMYDFSGGYLVCCFRLHVVVLLARCRAGY